MNARADRTDTCTHAHTHTHTHARMHTHTHTCTHTHTHTHTHTRTREGLTSTRHTGTTSQFKYHSTWQHATDVCTSDTASMQIHAYTHLYLASFHLFAELVFTHACELLDQNAAVLMSRGILLAKAHDQVVSGIATLYDDYHALRSLSV